MCLALQIKTWARELGFQLVGIAAAGEAETRAFYEEWVAAGHAGEMGYMARAPARRAQPQAVWPPAASIVVVGLNYRPAETECEAENGPPRGRVARYAL